MFQRPHHPHRHTLFLSISFILVCATLASYGWWKQTQVMSLMTQNAQLMDRASLLAQAADIASCPALTDDETLLATCRNALAQAVDAVSSQYELYNGSCKQSACVFYETKTNTFMGTGMLKGYYEEQSDVTSCGGGVFVVTDTSDFAHVLSRMAETYPDLIKKDDTRLTVAVGFNMFSKELLVRLNKSSPKQPVTLFGQINPLTGDCGTVLTAYSLFP